MSGAADGESLLGVVFAARRDEDLHRAYRDLRERAPVLVTRVGVLVLSRYADVQAALRDRRLGKTDEALRAYLGAPAEDQVRAAMRVWRRTVFFTNPPDHTRLRRLISDEFTPRYVDRLRASVVADIDDVLDGFAETGGGEFMSRVARPLPVRVISRLLGVPLEESTRFGALVRDMAALLESSAEADLLTRALAAQSELVDYFTELVRDKRRRPGDDLLSRLTHSGAGDALDGQEIVATALLLFAAGFETTSNMLGNGLHALITHPDQMEWLRRHPDRSARAVEELLRFEPPAHLATRTVLEPGPIAGVADPGCSTVLLMLAAANRDPDRFTDPQRLRIDRDEGGNLAFAAGNHFCLGAHLARLEAAEFFQRFLHRFPQVELAGAAHRFPSPGVRGFALLPVAVGALPHR